jgi:hypothetical protein
MSFRGEPCEVTNGKGARIRLGFGPVGRGTKEVQCVSYPMTWLSLTT